MEDDYKIYCIDALDRTWIVDGTQVPTVETLKYEFGTIFRTVSPVLRSHFCEEDDENLFNFHVDGDIKVNNTWWASSLQGQSKDITIRMTPISAQHNREQIFEHKINMRMFEDCVMIEGSAAQSHIEFVDPLGRRALLSTAMCRTYDHLQNYASIVLRGVRLLRSSVALGDFEFIRGKDVRLSHQSWKVDKGMKIRMRMVPVAGRRKQEAFSYPGRRDLSWDSFSCQTAPKMRVAMSSVVNQSSGGELLNI